jgi:hypothetical protein
LRDQRLHAVFDEGGITAVFGTGGEAAGQTKHTIGRAQQQCAGICGDAAAVKTRNERTIFNGCKIEEVGVTRCQLRAASAQR